jgi:hypothetical protein
VTTDCVNQNLTINAEERGAQLLPVLGTLDLRFGRFFDLTTRGQFEVSMDVYNVTNANTTYDVRQGTGRTSVRYANDATQPTVLIPTYLSPTGVLGPRIIRFNVTYTFGAR